MASIVIAKVRNLFFWWPLTWEGRSETKKSRERERDRCVPESGESEMAVAAATLRREIRRRDGYISQLWASESGIWRILELQTACTGGETMGQVSWDAWESRVGNRDGHTVGVEMTWTRGHDSQRGVHTFFVFWPIKYKRVRGSARGSDLVTLARPIY